MKKFRSFKNKEESSSYAAGDKKNKTALYITLFLAAIMVLSIFGVFLWNPSTESDYSYGKYSFKPSNGNWITKINGKEKAFYYLPQELLRFNASSAIFNTIKYSQGLVIVLNGSTNLTQRLQVQDLFKLGLADAMMSSYPDKKLWFSTTGINASLPQITCQNASYVVPVMTVDFSNETKTDLKGSCIVVTATDEYSMLNILDGLRYGIFGVLNEKEA